MFNIIFIISIVLVVVYLVNISNKQDTGQNQQSPLDILKERYARGEIDRDEYEEKKKELV